MSTNESGKRARPALRGRILDAARRIVVRDGLAALSMRKIADAIGYAPATLYVYFSGRDEIAGALRAQVRAQLLDALASTGQIDDPRERLRTLAQAYLRFAVEHPQAYRLVFMPEPDHGAMRRVAAEPAEAAEAGDAALAARVTQALEAIEAQGALPAGADSEAWAGLILATLHGIVASMLAGEVAATAEAAARRIDLAFDAWFGARRRDAPQASKAVASA
ncbi:TetR/AcrR family transcriptional regulator [Burkholderia sp. WAC0059]|uniref:TetR/AcrR family transcriptional regulator n=1 Tax=Burkholderia sp. WAC0059 TaxID=2066022 RepID=UPI0015E0C25A|nr:TetR/AcrR family transcriptional regulator [Burkholderia sp. WAC0059]